MPLSLSVSPMIIGLFGTGKPYFALSLSRIPNSSWGASWGEAGYFRVKRTPGNDPCQFYKYWSQATAVGANETYAPPKAGGGEFVVPTTRAPTVATVAPASSSGAVDECGEGLCEEDCGCDDYDEDDEDEVDEEEEEVLEL